MTTALRDAIDYTTLGWVKPELDETLRQARIEIEAFAEDPSDTSRMRFCAGFLHQVQGTLRMVELYAPAMVAEEMEQLAHALQDGSAPDRDEACATLMRGVVLLPDYLERLQGGHRDIPIVLLPLLNELRAARGESGLSESVLFAPDLQKPLPETLGAAGRTPEANAGPLLAQLRDALAAWPEGGAPADAAALAAAVDGLLAQVGEEAGRRMLWVASSVAGALRDGALPPTPALRQAFASVEREARQLLEQDGMRVRADAALEPTRQLLYHVAHADGDHAALRDLRSTFELDAQGPSESELEHARGSVTGRNRALLDTVAAAVKEDLLRVKDALDLHLRGGQPDLETLRPQVEALGRVADTLGMLGLGVARNVVQQQRDALAAIVDRSREADEGALLDVAGALLYVDASLDEQVQRLGGPADGGDEDLLAAESRRVTEVLAREAIANFADARQAFVAFVETNWDHAELAEVPRLLREVAGAMRMLELAPPAGLLDGVRMYAERELIARHRVPNGRQLDTLADALASLEYYLEALREQRPNRDDILEIARTSLETLGYWPLPSGAAPEPAMLPELPEIAEPAVEVEGAPAVPAPSAPSQSAAEAPAAPVAPPVAPAAVPVGAGH
ncbi:MAG TPA: Hpt domain-containing protein, partial [Xanthomonadaceae bacterium]|nr:Hpt domain-containing protein [Xanthomonadaceae bacterium]